MKTNNKKQKMNKYVFRETSRSSIQLTEGTKKKLRAIDSTGLMSYEDVIKHLLEHQK